MLLPTSDADVGNDAIDSHTDSRPVEEDRNAAHMVFTVRESLLLLALAATILSTTQNFAILASSRMYGTGCSTRHINFSQTASYVSKKFT